MVRSAGVAAIVFWILLCVRWFDPGEPFRPRLLLWFPPVLLALGALCCLVYWLTARWRRIVGQGGGASGLYLAVALSILFRLPMVWWSAAGHVTPDASLSGIIAVHLHDGKGHLVYIPNSGYSGSLKSHLTVALFTLIGDMPRAFAFASVLFYAFFVAALYKLGEMFAPEGPLGLYAALYAAFSSPWITHYSLSNDGNYVEVLALGSWALFLACLWVREKEDRELRALAIGLLLGVSFWCHILAVIYAVAIVSVFVALGGAHGLRCLPRLVGGFVIGFLPGILWNAGNGWFSFGYLLTGAHQDHPVDPTAFVSRILPMITDHWPILMGYDPSFPGILDPLDKGIAWLAVGAAAAGAGLALRKAFLRLRGPQTVLLVFVAADIALALIGTEHIPGNPRYLLFLMTALPVFLASVLSRGFWRILLFVLVATGAVTSIAGFPQMERADEKWRSFVHALEAQGVRFCHSDYTFASKINFLSEERVICSSRLGPTYSDPFDYASVVDQAPEDDLIPINKTKAARLETRLAALGVRYERLDLMKPVLLRLSRKVDPDELRDLDQSPLGSTAR